LKSLVKPQPDCTAGFLCAQLTRSHRCKQRNRVIASCGFGFNEGKLGRVQRFPGGNLLHQIFPVRLQDTTGHVGRDIG